MSRLYGEILKIINVIFFELFPFENFEIWRPILQMQYLKKYKS